MNVKFRFVLAEAYPEIKMTRAKVLCFALIIVAFVSASCRSSGNNQATKPAEKIAAEERASGPMPAGAFKALITVPEPPAGLQPGQKLQLRVKVKNIGDTTWPAHGRPSDGYYQVNLGDNWYDDKNKRIEKHPYVRSGLPHDLRPGEEVEIPLNITAPPNPGNYDLQIDMVQEMVNWFSERGSAAPKIKVKVG
jgi:hypothetical protein